MDSCCINQAPQLKDKCSGAPPIVNYWTNQAYYGTPNFYMNLRSQPPPPPSPQCPVALNPQPYTIPFPTTSANLSSLSTSPYRGNRFTYY